MSIRVPVLDQRPGDAPLDGHRVRLVPLAWPNPGEALSTMMAGEAENLWDYMVWGPFAEPADAEAALRERQVDGEVMVIFDREERVLGTASYLRVRPQHGSAEIGSIAYGSAMQRSPAGTEAMYLMIKHLFDDLNYRRCEWKCNAENEKSFRAAERLGFTYEGTHRQDQIVKGKNRDTAWFSITDDEWPSRRAAWESWLDPVNFDEKGRQKKALREFVGGPYCIPSL